MTAYPMYDDRYTKMKHSHGLRGTETMRVHTHTHIHNQTDKSELGQQTKENTKRKKKTKINKEMTKKKRKGNKKRANFQVDKGNKLLLEGL